MALNSDALTTLSNLKEVLGISSSDTSKDGQIERAINRATAWIESETNRKLKARGYNGASGNFTIGGSDTIANEDYIYFNGSTKDRGGDTVVDERGYGLFYLPAFPCFRIRP